VAIDFINGKIGTGLTQE